MCLGLRGGVRGLLGRRTSGGGLLARLTSMKTRWPGMRDEGDVIVIVVIRRGLGRRGVEVEIWEDMICEDGT